MRSRPAAVDDSRLLAELNHQLISDQGHRNPMTVVELEARMRGWLSTGEYRGLIFEDTSEVIAYALYRETADEVHLRHFFVVRHRRRQGVGWAAMRELLDRHWPPSKRLTVSVLVNNTAAVSFWRTMGYADYDLTLEILPRK